jgi:hypothetical protein
MQFPLGGDDALEVHLRHAVAPGQGGDAAGAVVLVLENFAPVG